MSFIFFSPSDDSRLLDKIVQVEFPSLFDNTFNHDTTRDAKLQQKKIHRNMTNVSETQVAALGRFMDAAFNSSAAAMNHKRTVVISTFAALHNSATLGHGEHSLCTVPSVSVPSIS